GDVHGQQLHGRGGVDLIEESGNRAIGESGNRGIGWFDRHGPGRDDRVMARALALAMLLIAGPNLLARQAPSVLHIKVTVPDAEGRPVALGRHALLISDNPVSAAPHRIVTSSEGTADINLRPGSYIVESDSPAALNGHAYEWSVIITVAAGLDTTLALTAGNARVGTAKTDTVAPASITPAEAPAASA